MPFAVSASPPAYNQRLYYNGHLQDQSERLPDSGQNLLTTNNYSLSLNATTLGLVQASMYVSDVRFEFGTVPSGFASVVKPTMRVHGSGHCQ
jgi:hypothetical protein